MVELRICPKCGAIYDKAPALSRADNKTLICPDCGVREGLESIGASKDDQDEILNIINKLIY